MADASRDQNFVPTLLGVSNADGETPVKVYADPTTHRLLVDLAGGAGTVTSVSVVSANGFAGSVADPTTTPAITLSTTITGILQGNGTAISAITVGSGLDFTGGTLSATGGTGDVVGPASSTDNAIARFDLTTGKLIQDSVVTVADTTGVIAGTQGVTFSGSTSGTLALVPTAISGTNTITLPASTGTVALTSDITDNITVGTTTITSGTTTRILYNNAGVVGEYTLTGTGTVVVMQTAPTFVTSITTPSVLATANDSGALGASGTAFSDLFLASGGVINWAAGDYTITHSTGILTANKDLRITTVGTDSTSVPTLGSSSTLTNKTLTNPTINAAVISGDFQVDGTPNTDDTWNGQSTNTFNAGATIAQFDCVYLSSSSTWLLTDADAVTTAGSVPVQMAAEAGTDTNPLRVILPGTFVRNDAWNWTPGAPLFLDTATPGGMTETAPSGTDDVVRIVAHAYTADVIFWNPSNDWITRV